MKAPHSLAPSHHPNPFLRLLTLASASMIPAPYSHSHTDRRVALARPMFQMPLSADTNHRVAHDHRRNRSRRLAHTASPLARDDNPQNPCFPVRCRAVLAHHQNCPNLPIRHRSRADRRALARASPLSSLLHRLATHPRGAPSSLHHRPTSDRLPPTCDGDGYLLCSPMGHRPICRAQTPHEPASPPDDSATLRATHPSR